MALKVGLIGTGWFANEHAQLISKQEDVQLTAVVGSSGQKAEQFASRFNDAKGFQNIDDMLDAGKLDAVYICTPPFVHGHIEEALIEREIPFLIEKPLSSEADLPAQLLQKIEAKQLITSVGYHFRYMDSADKAKQLLAERNIAMSLGYWMGGAPGGTWWRRQELSGGQFVEQTTHIVDLLRYLVGEVTEVYAAYSDGILSKQDAKANVADAGTVTLKLSNGTIATISNTCVIPTGYLSGLHIYTDAGKLELGHSGLKDITTASTIDYHNRSNPYENETKAFLHAVRTGDTSLIRSTYEDAHRTHQVTIAANESAATGQVIKLG